jgi:hypothetical protein
VVLALSRAGAALVRELPVAWRVGLQGFRVAVELVLARLHHEGVVPVQMMFEGANFDILTGLSALALAAYGWRRPIPRALLVGWNVVGTLLLSVIVVIAVLSMPTPFRAFHDGPANAVVADFPFVWLPTVLVPAALFGHVVVFRRVRSSGAGSGA